MTISLFILCLIAGAALTMLFTNSIKQFYYNKGKSAPPNLIALLNAVVIGCGQGLFVYTLLAIPFTIQNILWLCFLVFLVWNASMQGWDKLLQTYQQFKKWSGAAQVSEEIEQATKIFEASAAADDLKDNEN